MKKIISYSLWGNNPKYTIGAIRNAESIPQFYPGWIGRFYCAHSVPDDIKIKLKELKCEVIDMPEEGDWLAMFWRFYPASDPDVEVMISRDTDSRLSEREVKAVEEWLKSDKNFHIMRDHPYHNFIIMGGMWGVRKPLLIDLKTLIAKFLKNNEYFIDQKFLRDVVYKIVKKQAFVHDSFYFGHSFPSKRVNHHFVGEPFSENEANDKKLNEMIELYDNSYLLRFILRLYEVFRSFITRIIFYIGK